MVGLYDEAATFIEITGREFVQTNIDELDKRVRKNIENGINALPRKSIKELEKEHDSVKKSMNMEKFRHMTKWFTPQDKLKMVMRHLTTYLKAVEMEIKKRDNE